MAGFWWAVSGLRRVFNDPDAEARRMELYWLPLRRELETFPYAS
jgi:hypothetical protein